jgi:hypothetical protein
VVSDTGTGRFLCDCGKWITLKKDGTFRKHWSSNPEWPGSRFYKLCPKSDVRP